MRTNATCTHRSTDGSGKPVERSQEETAVSVDGISVNAACACVQAAERSQSTRADGIIIARDNCNVTQRAWRVAVWSGGVVELGVGMDEVHGTRIPDAAYAARSYSSTRIIISRTRARTGRYRR
eukprot:SAG31_NODE_11710_length_1004_cov_1.647514_1_plen_123_part_10